MQVNDNNRSSNGKMESSIHDNQKAVQATVSFGTLK